jgi:hypothetical protein
MKILTIALGAARFKAKRRRLPALVAALLAGLMPVLLRGASLTPEAVQAGVETWVRHVTADARPDAVIEKIEPCTVNGQTFAYVAQLAGGGFCLCGADDRLLPVYLYTPWGKYEPSNPNNQYVLSEIRSRLTAFEQALQAKDPALQQYAAELSRRAAYWKALLSGQTPATDKGPGPKDAANRLALPLTSHWDQGSPYNDDCPNLTPGQDERTVVGCVALAMAQIMYYWQWPAAGTGAVPTAFPFQCWFSTTWLGQSLSFAPPIPADTFWTNRLRWDTTAGGTLWMNGYWDPSVYVAAQQITNNTAYKDALAALWARMTLVEILPNISFNMPIQWDLIRDAHTDPPDAGDAAVAALCYEVGISTYMHYGIVMTSGDDGHIAEALKSYFFYDPAASYQDPDPAKIVDEIQWMRPVHLGGNGPPLAPAGHAWIAQGYYTGTTPTQFLMNLGWRGVTNSWYSLDQCFPTNQVMTIRMAPLNAVKFVGAATSGNGSPTSPYAGIEEALANAPSGATLIFKAGSDNTFAASPLTIGRSLTLKSMGATIRKQ